MMRRLRNATALAGLALVTLTGCFKMDYDLNVEGDKVSGTMIVATDKDFAESEGVEVEGDSFNFDEKKLVEAGAKVEVEPYDDGRFVGEKATFSDVPIDKISLAFENTAPTGDVESSAGAEEFSITRDGDEYTFTARADVAESMSDGETTDADSAMFDKMFESMLDTAEANISITLPGEVTDTNGTLDGNTVTWEVDVLEPIDFYAVSDVSGAADGGVNLVGVLGAVILVALIGAVGFFGFRRWRERPQDGQESDVENAFDDDTTEVPVVDEREAFDVSVAAAIADEPVQVTEQGSGRRRADVPVDSPSTVEAATASRVDLAGTRRLTARRCGGMTERTGRSIRTRPNDGCTRPLSPHTSMTCPAPPALASAFVVRPGGSCRVNR